MKPLYVTAHAVERYIERWEPGLSALDARVRIVELVSAGHAVRQKTLKGHDVWASGGVHFVTRTEPDQFVIVTTLPRKNEDRLQSEFAEFLEWWEEQKAYTASLAPALPVRVESTSVRAAVARFKEAASLGELGRLLQIASSELMSEAKREKHAARQELNELSRTEIAARRALVELKRVGP